MIGYLRFRLSLFLTIIFCLNMFFYPTESLGAQIPVTLSVNQQWIDLDNAGTVQDGRTMLPVRFIVEAFGAERIEWDAPESRATVYLSDGRILVMQADDCILFVDGQPFELSRALPCVEGRILVPISELKDILGFSISYDARLKHVSLMKNDIQPEPKLFMEPIDQEALMWLSRIVHVEAMGQPMENKLAVANVVLNRVRSDSFPDTVQDVIFQKDVYTQFPPAHKEGFRDIVPTDQSLQAAKAALLGVNNIEDCLFFNNRPFSGMQNRLYLVLNGEYFYR